MKKIIVIVGLALSSCSSYKMEIMNSSAGTFYRVYRRHNSHWDGGQNLFYSEKAALEKIEDWRKESSASKPMITKKYSN
jgi:prephenate dehydrogenase